MKGKSIKSLFLPPKKRYFMGDLQSWYLVYNDPSTSTMIIYSIYLIQSLKSLTDNNLSNIYIYIINACYITYIYNMYTSEVYPPYNSTTHVYFHCSHWPKKKKIPTSPSLSEMPSGKRWKFSSEIWWASKMAPEKNRESMKQMQQNHANNLHIIVSWYTKFIPTDFIMFILHSVVVFMIFHILTKLPK